MIIEVVECDWCAETTKMLHGMVPDGFYQHDGRHYCSTYCLTKSEPALDLVAWPKDWPVSA